MVTTTKILVFSDSHGQLSHMIAAVEEERPNRVFFLGDHYRDGQDLKELYPDIPMELVRGNCDWGQAPEDRVVLVEGVRFFLTHGHKYWVKQGLDQLRRAGREREVQMVCFGHTHISCVIHTPGYPTLFNPGTAGGVGARPSYGLLTVCQGQVSAQVK